MWLANRLHHGKIYWKTKTLFITTFWEFRGFEWIWRAIFMRPFQCSCSNYQFIFFVIFFYLFNVFWIFLNLLVLCCLLFSPLLLFSLYFLFYEPKNPRKELDVAAFPDCKNCKNWYSCSRLVYSKKFVSKIQIVIVTLYLLIITSGL